MKLNCEAGKMAIVAKAFVMENQSKTLTTIRLATDADLAQRRFHRVKDEPVWIIDRALKNADGRLARFAYDCQLRKISGDQPGNEYSFKTAPKSLPATTKGDTIDARGELA